MLAGLVISVVVLGSAGMAGADCSLPSITVDPGTSARGGTILVVGRAFADKCIDVLPTDDVARPIEDVELLVTQGGNEWSVGRVDADDDFTFEASVVVPTAAQPGPATVLARFDGWVPAARWNQELQITNEQAPTSSMEPDADNSPGAELGANDGGISPVAIALAALGVALLAATAWVLTRRRSRASSPD